MSSGSQPLVEKAELRRELGLLDAVGIGLGAVLGAGIFVVLGVAAGVAGPGMLLGLVVAGAAAGCNGLSAAQLGAKFPRSGGTYESGSQVLGPELGFAAGWMFLSSKLAAAGTVALGFGHALHAFWPGLPVSVAAAGAVVGLTLANLAGIRKAGRLNLGIVAVTLAALLLFVGAGMGQMAPGNFQPWAPQGGRAVMESAALLFFAYTGYARLATLGEEVREPERTIPRAILLTLAISCVLYLAVAGVAVGAAGAPLLAGSRTPLQSAAEAWGANWLAGILGVAAATAMLGVLLSQILGISRMMLAMARRGDLPGALGVVDAKRGVPARAVLLTAGVALVQVVLGTLEGVIAAAAFTILIYYSITNLAALRLAAADRLFPRWISLAGLLACVGMAAFLEKRTIVFGLGLLALGFGLRLIWRRWGVRRG